MEHEKKHNIIDLQLHREKRSLDPARNVGVNQKDKSEEPLDVISLDLYRRDRRIYFRINRTSGG